MYTVPIRQRWVREVNELEAKRAAALADHPSDGAASAHVKALATLMEASVEHYNAFRWRRLATLPNALLAVAVLSVLVVFQLSLSSKVMTRSTPPPSTTE